MSYRIYKISHNIVFAVRAILSSILILALSFFSLTFTSDFAYADDTAEIMQKVRTIRASIDAAQSEYLSSTQYAEQIEAQCNAVQQELEEYKTRLAEKRGDLDRIIIDEYKAPVADTFLSALVGAKTLEDAFSQMEYANRITEDRRRTTAETVALAKQVQEKSDELEMKKTAATQAVVDAEAAKHVWDDQLEEMRPQIKQLREEYFAQVEGKSGNAQLEAALTYLEDVEGATSEQVALLHAAYSTGYAGSNYCERWIERVFRNAGIDHGNYVGASDNMVANMRSDDLNAIPVGALVFGSGTSAPYGHVGICVAAGTGHMDALILDNEGSRSGTAVPLSEWGEWQTATSWKNGRSGLFGWGYPDSIYLAPVTY